MIRPELLRHVVQAATLAPSVHNTQPWRFVAAQDRIELFADLSRQLPVLDPDGRQLHLSCGAALMHLRVAARSLGLAATVDVLPDTADTTHLATVHVAPGAAPTADDVALATAILYRHTRRGAFDARRLPSELVERLRLVVEEEGAFLRPVVDEGDRVAVEVLLSRADDLEQADAAYVSELKQWVREGTDSADGVPREAVTLVPGSSLRQREFLVAPNVPVEPPVAENPDVVVLATAGDDAAAWLAAGQALGLLLLRAADSGVLAQPLGQLTDLLGCRFGLRKALGMVGFPQLVLRMGFAGTAPVTPRRTVEDVLERVAG